MNQARFLRFCLTGFLLLLGTANTSFGQELDMDCRPILLPTQCNSIANQLSTKEQEIKDEIRALQEELQTAAPNAKAAIVGQIKRKQGELANSPVLKGLRTSLAACRQQFDTTPRRPVAPAVLNANFAGTVTNTTSSTSAPGPFLQTVGLGLQFSQNRCDVKITSFPSIIFTAPTPIGGITVTISQTGGGSGNFFPVIGDLIMPLTLRYTYGTFLANPDTASFLLTTGSITSPIAMATVTGAKFSSSNGGPVDDCGKVINGTAVTCTITLVGTTTFQNGFLRGNFGDYVVTGTISVPQPAVTSACLNQCAADYIACVADAEPGRAGATVRARCNQARAACRNNCPH
jgi:hypothetical protein